MSKIWLENNEVKSDMDLSIFDDDQMTEIHRGLERNLDVSIYAKSEYDDYQMAEIRRGLEENIDVTIYAKSEFNCVQMRQIRQGLERNLDVSIYAKPEYNWDQMAAIRLGLTNALDNTPKKMEIQEENALFDEAAELFKKLWNDYAVEDNGLYIGGKLY